MPPLAVVCYSKNEIHSRLAWLLQPTHYRDSGPVALIAVQTDESPWTESHRSRRSGGVIDPYADQADALRATGADPMVSLLHEILGSVGNDRDLIFSLASNVYGVLRAPITRPAEPESFANGLLVALTEQTSTPLWCGVAVSVAGDTPGLLLSHCSHALDQASQLGSGHLAVFDEVDRTVVQMQLNDGTSKQMTDLGGAAHRGGNATEDEARATQEADPYFDSGNDDDAPDDLIDRSKLPVKSGLRPQ